jgi:aminoglycoside 2'-N-acetyltransferase I
MQMMIEIRRTAELGPSDLEEIGSWLALVSPPDGYTWSGFDWLALGRVDGRVVTHVGVTERDVLVDGRPMKVGGVGNVATRPEWRGRGFAAEAVVESTAFLCNREEVGFILLVCLADVAAFYQNLGWETIDGPVSFDQPQGRMTWPNVAMVWSCTGEPWPGGAIDLCGLPW